MKTLEKIRALPHVLHVDDERNCGNSIIVMLQEGWEFANEPGCGTQGFDNVTDAKNGTTAKAVVQKT